MNINAIPAGKYILAISGGVDSMVLLDLLAAQANSSGFELVVAHFNHGIRPDSIEDQQLVELASHKHGLPFEVGLGNLGADASEAAAREARYKFLESVTKKHRADAIITAHHQDDLVETAILNILRGTGPRGLSAIAQSRTIRRPLLNVPKSEIVNYAKARSIKWREDSTNQDQKYLRNYIRKNITANLSRDQRQQFLKNINTAANNQTELDAVTAMVAQSMQAAGRIDRQKFINLPNDLGRELVAFWLRGLGLRDFDKSTIERIQMAIKTSLPGSRHNVIKGLWLITDKTTAQFEPKK